MSEVESLAAVAFLSARLRERLTKPNDINNVPELAAQFAAVQSVAKALKCRVTKIAFPNSTYRRRRFTDEPSFREAVRAARELGVRLIIGDVFGSLSSGDEKDAVATMEVLDRLDILVMNAADGRSWASYTTSEKLTLALSALRRKLLRSKAIKEGLPVKRDVDSGELRARQRVGARRVASNANRNAAVLAGVVGEIRANAGLKFSPTVLARELNLKGVLSPRGKRWSPTTAQRLLQRLSLIESEAEG